MIGNATLSTMFWSKVRFVAPDCIANISRVDEMQKCKEGIGFVFFIWCNTLGIKSRQERRAEANVFTRLPLLPFSTFLGRRNMSHSSIHHDSFFHCGFVFLLSPRNMVGFGTLEDETIVHCLRVQGAHSGAYLLYSPICLPLWQIEDRGLELCCTLTIGVGDTVVHLMKSGGGCGKSSVLVMLICFVYTN